jgi:hypothetical protein
MAFPNKRNEVHLNSYFNARLTQESVSPHGPWNPHHEPNAVEYGGAQTSRTQWSPNITSRQRAANLIQETDTLFRRRVSLIRYCGCGGDARRPRGVFAPGSFPHICISNDILEAPHGLWGLDRSEIVIIIIALLIASFSRELRNTPPRPDWLVADLGLSNRSIIIRNCCFFVRKSRSGEMRAVANGVNDHRGDQFMHWMLAQDASAGDSFQKRRTASTPY